MAEANRQVVVVEVDDSSSPIACLTNKSLIGEYDETEDCFILDFDPYDIELDFSAASLRTSDDDSGFILIAQHGQVACRDYPHPRHACAEFPFDKTSHQSYCKMCFCHVCDSSAPCLEWEESHCHAFDDAQWNRKKKRARGSSTRTRGRYGQ